MKIESIIRRKNGTRVEMDEKVYHFKPTHDDERHIADVDVAEHVKRFLSIPEGFQPAEISELKATTENGPLAASQPVLGTLAGVQEKDGTVTTLPQLPREQLLVLARDMEIKDAESMTDDELVKAIAAEPAEVVEDNEKSEEKGEEKQDAEEKSEEKKEPAPLDRETLAKQYKAKFGKAPHHKLSAERIAQILAEEEAE